MLDGDGECDRECDCDWRSSLLWYNVVKSVGELEEKRIEGVIG
jgi:hypothetical protein